MNACAHDLETLSTYLDGEATPDQEHQVREQLAQCPHCQQAHQAMSQLRAGLRHYQPPPLQVSAQDLLRKPEADLRYPPLRLGHELITPWLRLIPTVLLLGLWVASCRGDAGFFCFWLGFVALGGFLSFSAGRRARSWMGSAPVVPGTLDHAMEPLWTTLWLATAGLWSITLSSPHFPHLWPQQWPQPGQLQVGALLVWCFPLAAACLPRRGHVLAIWLGLTALLALSPGCSLAVAGLGLLALLVGARKQLRWRYSTTLLLLDLAGVGLAFQLHALYTMSELDTAFHWTTVPSPLRTLQNQTWVVPWLLASWWVLVRTPLASAFELLQPTLWRRAVGALVGLGLGLVVCMLLSSETQLLFPLVPLQHLAECLLGGSLLGLLSSWNAHGPLPAPQRLLCLRSRVMVGSSLLALTMAWLGWTFQKTFPTLPQPTIHLGSIQPPPTPTLPAWLRESFTVLHEHNRNYPPDLQRDPKIFAQARQQFLDNYKQLEHHPDPTLNPHIAECLADLGLEQKWAGRPEQAVEYYLESQRWNPGSQHDRFLGILQDVDLSAPTYRKIVECWQAAPDPDCLPQFDRDYSQYQSNLAGAPLPGYYRDFESKVCANFYVRFRAAVTNYQNGAQLQLPNPTEWSAQYPCAPLSEGFIQHLTDDFGWQQQLRTRRPLILLLSTLHLYQLEHGTYPQRLDELKAYLPTLPKNYLAADGKFRYRLKGKNFELSTPTDLRNNPNHPLPTFRSGR